MATLYITEFADVGHLGGLIPVAAELPAAEQTRSLSGTSAQSSAFNNATNIVRLQTDTACFVKFGTNPTAVTASSMPLAANTPEYFSVPKGQAYKVAAIT